MPFNDAGGKIDDAQSRRIVDTNLLGPIRLTSALIDHLKAQPKATIIHKTSVLAYLPLAFTAVYSATKGAAFLCSVTAFPAARHQCQRAGNRAAVDRYRFIKKSDDPRAMPLDIFMEKTMKGLGTEAEEIYVEEIKAIRDNPGSGEHALFNAFNESLAANPIPV